MGAVGGGGGTQPGGLVGWEGVGVEGSSSGRYGLGASQTATGWRQGRRRNPHVATAGLGDVGGEGGERRGWVIACRLAGAVGRESLRERTGGLAR